MPQLSTIDTDQFSPLIVIMRVSDSISYLYTDATPEQIEQRMDGVTPDIIGKPEVMYYDAMQMVNGADRAALLIIPKVSE